MSIIITNITDESKDYEKDSYVVRINKKIICEFKHKRKINGLADCLRDAAGAVDNQSIDSHAVLLELLNGYKND